MSQIIVFSLCLFSTVLPFVYICSVEIYFLFKNLTRYDCYRAKFGTEMSGSTRKSIFTISKSETDKMKVLRQFMKHAKDKKSERKRRKIKTQTTDNEKLNLNRHNYGAWYLEPSKWEERFQNLSDPKAIAIIKTRNMSNKRFAIKEEVAIQEVSYLINNLINKRHGSQTLEQTIWL